MRLPDAIHGEQLLCSAHCCAITAMISHTRRHWHHSACSELATRATRSLRQEPAIVFPAASTSTLTALLASQTSQQQRHEAISTRAHEHTHSTPLLIQLSPLVSLIHLFYSSISLSLYFSPTMHAAARSVVLLVSLLVFLCAAVPVALGQSPSVGFTFYNTSEACTGSSYSQSVVTSLLSNGNFTTACTAGDESGSFTIACSSSSASYFVNVYDDAACAAYNGTYVSISGRCDAIGDELGYPASLLVNCINSPSSSSSGGNNAVASATPTMLLLPLFIAIALAALSS